MSYENFAQRHFANSPKVNVSSIATTNAFRVGSAETLFENEADYVASHLGTGAAETAAWSISTISIGATLQRKCDCGRAGQCKECDKLTLHRHPQKLPASNETTAPGIVHEVLSSSGQPLDRQTLGFMEPRFGYDFSRVRVHSNARSARSAQSVNAMAYTVGNDVVFNSGQYRPSTETGRRLLAHELTHVVQQGAADRTSHVVATSRKTPSVVLRRQSGWSDARGKNKQQETIYQNGSSTAPNSAASSVVRIPIEQLTEGNQTDSMFKRTKMTTEDPVTHKSVPVIDPVTNKQKTVDNPVSTREKAAGKAIAIVPSGLDPVKPVEILLHLHGHNVGYRQVGTSVRDVDLDEIEQQMIASGRTQLIAILPQGTTASGFGASGLKSDIYMDQILARIATARGWANTPTVSSGVDQVALSAHSGGGGRVQEMLAGAPGSLPNKMKELVLFEAINGPGELAAVKLWISTQIQNDVNQLRAISTKDGQDKYLASSMRFRGYYTPTGDYVQAYRATKAYIQEQFAQVVSPAGLSADLVNTLTGHYAVIAVSSGAGHDNILGQGGQLQDALSHLPAMTQPTSAKPAASVSSIAPASGPQPKSAVGPESDLLDAGTAPWGAHGVPLRPKLMIGNSNDPSEREADQVADRILQMPMGNNSQPIHQGRGLDTIPSTLTVLQSGASTIIRRQTHPTVAVPWTVSPTRANEVGKTLSTYNCGPFSIFVPTDVTTGSAADDRNVKVHVFFAAGGVQSADANDILLHGLRGSSDHSKWILIGVSGISGGANAIGESQIVSCLHSVGITNPPVAFRLTGHSRGCDSLRETLSRKLIRTALIERVVFLDEAVEHVSLNKKNPDRSDDPSRGSVRINRVNDAIKSGIAPGKISAYESTNLSKNLLTGKSSKVPGATYHDLNSSCVSAIGAARLVEDAIALDPMISRQANANQRIVTQLANLHLPPRGSFTTGPTTATQTNINDFCFEPTIEGAKPVMKAVVRDILANPVLIAFINRNDLGKYSNVPDWGRFAAHEFFVAEIAHELTD